jgi:hypothetical protein
MGTEVSYLAEMHDIPQRRVYKRRRAVLVGAGLLLGLVGIFLWWVGRPPALRFVHRGTRVCQRHSANSRVSVYSLAGEFQELAARARAELLARGFREEDRGDGDLNCVLVRGGYTSRVRTIVVVKDFAFAGATSDSILYRPQPGHISVEVQHIRRPVLEYLPVKWQYRYQRCVHPGKEIRLVEPAQPGRPRTIRLIPPGQPSFPPGGRRQPASKDPNNR